MSLPILTYHAVESAAREHETLPPNKARYLVKRDLFERQMRFLAERRFRTLLVDDLIAAAQGRSSLPEQGVCLTFDDGSASDYQVAFPILKKYSLNATFFVVTERVGTPGYVTWDQLGEMSTHGMSIQSHSHTHPIMSQCGDVQVREELRRSKEILDDRLGRAVSAFAVPGGHWNAQCRLAAKECGYRAICTSQPGVNGRKFELDDLERLSIRRADSFDQFVSFVTLDRRALLQYQVKETLLKLAKRGMGLNRYNRVRAWLLSRMA
jgi:peptidoglycan/xylan/chitin deacetylase (PgdA/CDA1 family)